MLHHFCFTLGLFLGAPFALLDAVVPVSQADSQNLDCNASAADVCDRFENEADDMSVKLLQVRGGSSSDLQASKETRFNHSLTQPGAASAHAGYAYTFYQYAFCSDDEYSTRLTGWTSGTTTQAGEACDQIWNCKGYHYNYPNRNYVLVSKVERSTVNTNGPNECYKKENASPTPLPTEACFDEPGWTNGYSACNYEDSNPAHCTSGGWTCAGMTSKNWCQFGRTNYGGGAEFNYPERYCCNCGGHASSDRRRSPSAGCSPYQVDRRRRNDDMCSCRRRREGESSTGRYACVGNSIVMNSAPPRRRMDDDRRRSPHPSSTERVKIRWANHPDKCLDVKDHLIENGNNVQIWDCQNGNDDQFWLLPTSGYGPIVWANHPWMCLDVKDQQDYNGNNMQMWNCDDPGTFHDFQVPRPWGETAPIHWMHAPSKCLDVYNHGDSNGNNVQLWQCINGNTDQNWRPSSY